jgi:VCBS repeat protein
MGYGDFNGDGIPDIVFSPGNATPRVPIIIALRQPGGSYVNGTTQVIRGEVPAPIVGRKDIVADFNGDGRPDSNSYAGKFVICQTIWLGAGGCAR